MAVAISRNEDPRSESFAEALLAQVERFGLAAHFHLRALITSSGSEATRNLADAVHLLCGLHGRHTGLLDQALKWTTAGAGRDWLDEACDGFERERLYLVRLSAGVGPLPSTPGSAATEATLAGQRHAIETLACSERRGCALGAAIALVGDWHHIRPMLNRIAERVGTDAPLLALPRLDPRIGMLATVDGEGSTTRRAISFGAEQMLLQHYGLFDLLEARASARSDQA